MPKQDNWKGTRLGLSPEQRIDSFHSRIRLRRNPQPDSRATTKEREDSSLSLQLPESSDIGADMMKVDYGRIHFPSDSVTLGDVRSSMPENACAFAESPAANPEHIQLGISGLWEMFYWERIAADMGVTSDKRRANRIAKIVSKLQPYYERLGVCDGKRTTDLLVRGIVGSAQQLTNGRSEF
ncbi:MAG: hypothetical protein R3E01_36265 [Pirellulaceae bacterium]